jgi:hypothetical protein
MQVRPVAGVVAIVAFGWALVTAADSRHEAKPPVFTTLVFEVEVPAASEWAELVDVATPVADSLVAWDELDRQTDCLWKFLRASGVDITLQTVLAAGTLTDALGGACLTTIGEDDE